MRRIQSGIASVFGVDDALWLAAKFGEVFFGQQFAEKAEVAVDRGLIGAFATK